MPFEPKKITRDNVLEAVKEIEENSLELIPSTPVSYTHLTLPTIYSV